ncbi:MAG: phosphoribosylanthranilate isomerase [Acidimicrobiales bacterium]
MSSPDHFVKVCGITTEQDALLAVALGATAVGFVFAPSKRQVAPGAVADIVKRLPPEVLRVGVFRDEAPERVSLICSRIGLNAAQLHGHETPEETKWLSGRIPLVIKAFSATDPRVADALQYGAFAIHLDAAQPGSGTTFDWAAASAVPKGERLIVAGGLNPSNVAEAITVTGCFGVDVSSGVEKAPGHKDPIKVREFIKEATRAFDARGRQGPVTTTAPAVKAGVGRNSPAPSARTLEGRQVAVAARSAPRQVGSTGRGPYDWQKDT